MSAFINNLEETLKNVNKFIDIYQYNDGKEKDDIKEFLIEDYYIKDTGKNGIFVHLTVKKDLKDSSKTEYSLNHFNNFFNKNIEDCGMAYYVENGTLISKKIQKKNDTLTNQ